MKKKSTVVKKRTVPQQLTEQVPRETEKSPLERLSDFAETCTERNPVKRLALLLEAGIGYVADAQREVALASLRAKNPQAFVSESTIQDFLLMLRESGELPDGLKQIKRWVLDPHSGQSVKAYRIEAELHKRVRKIFIDDLQEGLIPSNWPSHGAGWGVQEQLFSDARMQDDLIIRGLLKKFNEDYKPDPNDPYGRIAFERVMQMVFPLSKDDDLNQIETFLPADLFMAWWLHFIKLADVHKGFNTPNTPTGEFQFENLLSQDACQSMFQFPDELPMNVIRIADEIAALPYEQQAAATLSLIFWMCNAARFLEQVLPRAIKGFEGKVADGKELREASLDVETLIAYYQRLVNVGKLDFNQAVIIDGEPAMVVLPFPIVVLENGKERRVQKVLLTPFLMFSGLFPEHLMAYRQEQMKRLFQGQKINLNELVDLTSTENEWFNQIFRAMTKYEETQENFKKGLKAEEAALKAREAELQRIREQFFDQNP